MPLEEDLLETAARLLSLRRLRGRPKQADLRRAISTAYYAVFHALCRMCADSLTGKGKKTRLRTHKDHRNAMMMVAMITAAKKLFGHRS